LNIAILKILLFMAYIFLDESGDLGFDFSKKKTSQYFVVTFLFVHKKRPVEKVIKNIFAGFSKREIKKTRRSITRP
jgi:hypothetical protein